VHRDFAAEPSSVAEARDFAVQAVARLSADGMRGRDAELIVSELVTNALRAGAHGIRVDLRLVDENLRVSVTDDASGWPAMRQASPVDVSGRGLALVAAVADEWGVVPLQVGKQVWADLSTTAQVAQ
jgi:anti-sigma regulatory factor (Ser/Thr protein kinase)